MKPTFNLLAEPWIPSIGGDGRRIELGLRDTLVRAHELRELVGESPLVTAALHRLLLAVLHRAVDGPADPDEWANLWEAKGWHPGQLDAYLEPWQHRFDLFAPDRPFYQAADERVKPKSVTSLIHQVASGNNPVLFDHHTDAVGIALPPAQAARMLVAAQAFGLGGLSGIPQKFTDAPCAGGIVFLVQGDNLFETLALNLLPYPHETVMRHVDDDQPAWEMDDPFAGDRAFPHGYLDYLTWQNRRVLYVPDAMNGDAVIRKMTVGPALRLDNSVTNPMLHYRLDKKLGPRPTAFREGRALWRDSASLLELHDEGLKPPQAFRWLAELVYEGVLSRSQTRRYLAMGMCKKQAKVNFYRSERMPLPLRYLQERKLVEALKDAVRMAEDTARQLWGAARTLATYVLSPQADADSGRQPAREDLDKLTQQWAVERRYWSRLEVSFREMVSALPAYRDEALADWRKTLYRAAWAAFDPLAKDLGHDPQALKAVVRARDQLAAGLAKALPRNDAAGIDSSSK